MKKKNDTLEETLLVAAENIIRNEGVDALNIRKLASEVGIASGTVYNYFDGKESILLSLTERYWKTAIVAMRDHANQDFLPDRLEAIYRYLQSSISDSAGELMSGLQNMKEGRKRMHFMFSELRAIVSEGMAQDTKIKADIWDDQLTENRFIDFIISNLISALTMKANNIDTLNEVVKRIIYA